MIIVLAKNANIGGRRFVGNTGGSYLLKKQELDNLQTPKPDGSIGDILEFLRPFMKDKERLTSVTTDNPSVSTINDKDTKCDTHLTEVLDASEDPQVPQDSEASYTPNASQIFIISQDDTLLRDSQSNLQVTVPPNKKDKTPKRAKSNVKVSTQAHTASGTLMKYLLEEAEVKDELDFFFESIKATVKKFSPADKHLVKSKIFGIVSDIEAKYTHQKQHIQNFPVYQASKSQIPLAIESPSTITFHSSNHSSSTSIRLLFLKALKLLNTVLLHNRFKKRVTPSATVNYNIFCYSGRTPSSNQITGD
ncbi:hypothetical protein FQA39_LY02147 [Lamprigera yunnana]|nr:hypothetical protein FQA39_LY02147 [Lamprigera yunnana]